MLVIEDIKRFVVEKINKNFDEKVIKEDRQEGYKKPSFFVYFDEEKMFSSNISQNKRIIPIIIQYKNTDHKKLRQTAEKLMEIFDYVQEIKGTRILIDEFSTDYYDNDLFMSFEISYYVRKRKIRETNENVNELHLRERGV